MGGGRKSPPPGGSGDRGASTGSGPRNGYGGDSKSRDRSPPPAKKAPPKEYVKPSWAKVGDDSSDASTLKKAKSILNKLTLEKFDRLAAEFCGLEFGSVGLVTGAIDLIVDNRATQGCFNCTSTLECLSDRKGVKKNPSTLREILREMITRPKGS